MLQHRKAPWLVVLLLGAVPARADIALLLEEPMGSFWSMQPAHSSIYLPRVCAATPVMMRRCRPGEEGVVISRYHRIDGFDWVAVALTPYLYSVDSASKIPASASPAEVAKLREEYRKNHLASVAPDPAGGRATSKDWPQLVGEAHDRSIYAYTIPTTEQQDDALIRMLNASANRNRFNIVYRNCADFAREILDFFHPGMAHRGPLELGVTTPQHIARDLARFARQHSLPLSVCEIAQIPGGVRRSKPMRGVAATPCTAPFLRMPNDISDRERP